MSSEFLTSLFCKKHNKIVKQGECQKCFEEGKAGFTNLLACMNYNINTIEGKDE